MQLVVQRRPQIMRHAALVFPQFSMPPHLRPSSFHPLQDDVGHVSLSAGPPGGNRRRTRTRFTAHAGAACRIAAPDRKAKCPGALRCRPAPVRLLAQCQVQHGSTANLPLVVSLIFASHQYPIDSVRYRNNHRYGFAIYPRTAQACRSGSARDGGISSVRASAPRFPAATARPWSCSIEMSSKPARPFARGSSAPRGDA